MKRSIIKILLSIVILVLAYLVVSSIMQPVQFENEKTNREKEVINKLKKIRDVQVQYKTAKGYYTASFDTLIDFINTGQLPVIKIIPDPNDTTFTKTISEIIGYVYVKDTLFKSKDGITPENLRFIPFSDGQEFEMEAGKIEISKTMVDVFEVKAHYKYILHGMDRQSIINLRKKLKELEKYEGLKVGSMNEASTDGNWEF